MKRLLVSLVLLLACADEPVTVEEPTAPGGVQVVAAGDIATTGSGDTKTSNLVLALDPARVLTLGDNVYCCGSTSQFNSLYDPTWGRFKSKTLPSPGNHDHKTSSASGYNNYFGKPDSTLVAYEGVVPGWDIYQVDTSKNLSSQVSALKSQLASNPDQCEIVYGHHPRWSSGSHGSDSRMNELWNALAAGNVEMLLSGHDHNYERFSPKSGVIQLVVGTGGVSTRPFGSTESGSVKRLTGSSNWGVLDLNLASGSFTGKFRAATGGTGTVRDSFSGSCS